MTPRALTPGSLEERVHQVVEDLQPYHPQQIILFGSAARGACDAFSDLDFIVIKDTDQPLLDRLKEVGLLCCRVSGAIDLLVYTPGEWHRLQEADSPFAERVMQEGRIVYEAIPERRG